MYQLRFSALSVILAFSLIFNFCDNKDPVSPSYQTIDPENLNGKWERYKCDSYEQGGEVWTDIDTTLTEICEFDGLFLKFYYYDGYTDGCYDYSQEEYQLRGNRIVNEDRDGVDTSEGVITNLTTSVSITDDQLKITCKYVLSGEDDGTYIENYYYKRYSDSQLPSFWPTTQCLGYPKKVAKRRLAKKMR